MASGRGGRQPLAFGQRGEIPGFRDSEFPVAEFRPELAGRSKSAQVPEKFQFPRFQIPGAPPSSGDLRRGPPRRERGQSRSNSNFRGSGGGLRPLPPGGQNPNSGIQIPAQPGALCSEWRRRSSEIPVSDIPTGHGPLRGQVRKSRFRIPGAILLGPRSAVSGKNV